MSENTHEKLFAWSPEQIGWYADACAYPENDRDSKLAAAVLAALPPRPSICDIGCGIGALSLALAQKAALVTSVDISAAALAHFRGVVSARGIENIRILEGDFRTFPAPAQKANCAVFCMVGGDGYIADARRWAERKIIVVNSLSENHSFSSKSKKSPLPGIERLRAFLASAGYSYSESVIPASVGQPFRSFEDAVRFISCYDRDRSRAEIAEFLDGRLVATGRPDFPLYFPNRKDYLVFDIAL